MATRNINHPNPKKVSVYNSTTFGKNVPPDNVNVFEYDAPKPIDFMRSRMNRTWYKVPEANEAEFIGWGPEIDPIEIVSDSSDVQNSTDPYIPWADQASTPPGKQKEKAIIQYNPTALSEAGNQPAEPSLTPLNKWLFAIESARDAGTGSPVDPTNLQPHGIVPTFDKLRKDPALGQTNDNAIVFYDHVFDYEAPLDQKQIGDNYYGALTVAAANVKPVYNFYIQPYEAIFTKFTGSDSLPESILPSLYSFLTMVQNTNDGTSGIQRSQTTGRTEQSSIDTIFEKHATLNKLINEYRVDTEVVFNRGQDTTTTAVSKGQYFDKYAYAFARETTAVADVNSRSWNMTNGSAEPVSLSNRFKHQVIPTANLDLFSTFADVTNRFPMYCDINFSTDSSNSEILKVLEETKLLTMLVKDFVDNKFTVGPPMDFNFVGTDGVPFAPPNSNFHESLFKTSNTENAEGITSGSLECWDVIQWANNLIGGDKRVTATGGDLYGQIENGVFLGKFNQEAASISQQSGGLNSINRYLNVLKFMTKLNQMANFTNNQNSSARGKTRTWKDMVGGTFNGVGPAEPKKAYHETIFYKVEKWEVDGTEPIQSFYFPNARAITEHRFTDTQVKYGKVYIYRIFAFEMVFGTKYRYQRDAAPVSTANLSTLNLKTNQARICIITEPSIKLIKVPYYEKVVVMMDSPPVMPDVEVVPFRGVENKLLFWLRGNTGNYKLNPIIIQPDDEASFDAIRIAQELGDLDPIQFKSDDHPRYFEVFRLEKKPSKYTDFEGSRLGFIDTAVNIDEACKGATAGSWIDTIQPNQKYYYLFRTMDNHGHFSNPSPVYEMEMVHDGYAPFLLRNVYQLPDVETPQVPAKSFSKYIYIKPAYTQTLLNKEHSGLIPSPDTDGCLTAKSMANTDWIYLGMDKQPLWKQKLKVRIISKKTGKRIDLNIKFRHKSTMQTFENNRNNKLC